MSDYIHHELLSLGKDETPYRLLTTDYVSTGKFEGHEILKVDTEGLTMLADQAIRDSAHLLRPGHLEQLVRILDDPEASDNDRFVALEMLKNANIAAGGVLPMCQDTGTVIVMGKKGNCVWTVGDDEAALSQGIAKAFAETNLRYSQLAPLDMFEEVNTRTNLPAQIEIFADQGAEYKLMFMAKGGGSANKSFLFQETRALLNLSAQFRLSEIGTGTAVYDGRSRATASYNIVKSQYATIAAEKNARKRASRIVAEDIAVRVSVCLSRKETCFRGLDEPAQ